MALAVGTGVITSDGVRIGKVEHVLAVDEKDIFDGLVIELDGGGMRFVDAYQVEEIYDLAVILTVSDDEAAELPKPAPSPGMMDSGGSANTEGSLEAKLHRAWDKISGKY
jgi:hypothetical protein